MLKFNGIVIYPGSSTLHPLVVCGYSLNVPLRSRESQRAEEMNAVITKVV